MNARILDILAPARAIALSANCKTVTPPTPCKPSQRTYYLGLNGRVSQRKHLVGELVATVRACSTDHARYLFTNALASISIQSDRYVDRPYIGKPTMCKCGRHHAKGQECYVMRNWSNLAGSAQTAPETLAERGVVCL